MQGSLSSGLILGIDTCGAECAAVLLDSGGEILVQRVEAMARGHAEALGPLVADMFRAVGAVPRDLAAIGVTLGPGSFTGLRVGLGFARGLGLGLGVAVTGISSILAPLVLADMPTPDRPVIALAPNPAAREDPKIRVEILRGMQGETPDVLDIRLVDLPGLLAGFPVGTLIVAPETWPEIGLGAGSDSPEIDARGHGRPGPRLDIRLLPIRPAALGAALTASNSTIPGARPAVPLYVRPPRATLPG